MVLSERVNRISPSPTLSIAAKANKMKAEGINIIGSALTNNIIDNAHRIVHI